MVKQWFHYVLLDTILFILSRICLKYQKHEAETWNCYYLLIEIHYIGAIYTTRNTTTNEIQRTIKRLSYAVTVRSRLTYRII